MSECRVDAVGLEHALAVGFGEHEPDADLGAGEGPLVIAVDRHEGGTRDPEGCGLRRTLLVSEAEGAFDVRLGAVEEVDAVGDLARECAHLGAGRGEIDGDSLSKRP